MPKTVIELRDELYATPAETVWRSGVRSYAVELFTDVAEARGLNIFDDVTVEITETELLNGADNWLHFSKGGCALVFNEDICRRLYGNKTHEKFFKSKNTSQNQPDWIELQAKALESAAKLVMKTVNKSINKEEQK